MLDLKIAGGQVYDGTGAAPRAEDVGVSDGVVAATGDLSRADARETIDALGMGVCPGFIDVHTHSDAFLLVEPSAPSKIRQGITTEVTGNCGVSAAPRIGAWRPPSEWESMRYPRPWSSMAEFRGLIEESRPAVNVAMLVGHGNLRAGVLGYENRPATRGELREMAGLLDRCLDEGAMGMSSGLVYPPGMFAAASELETLAGTVARRGGIYTTHMASEGKSVVECVRQTVELGRKTGARVEISHLKTSGRDNWHKAPEMLDLIRGAREKGVEIAADRYPYTYGCTDLDVVFPAWAEEGGRAAIMERLRDPSTVERLRRELSGSRNEEGWGGITIASTWHPDNLRFRGRPLPEVAAAMGMSSVDAVLFLAVTDELRTEAFFHGMSEENMMAILAEPFVMIGSDASLRSPDGPLGRGFPHPRAYGAFPRFLRMALDGRTVHPAEAIRKMTSLPASHFGIANRGTLAQGKAADIVVFDPATVRDTAAPDNPHRFPVGIPHVIVNGRAAIRNGIATGERPGRVL